MLTGSGSPGGNTFLHWPHYQRMMTHYGERANRGASALMIGSLTPLSSRSFVCLAQTEYGVHADKTFIVDPRASRYKARHGNFVFGSGLALPFASGSIDFMHTNHLLHALVDLSSKSRPRTQSIFRLFSEIGRVLAPGGQLLMKELALDYRQLTSDEEAIQAIETLEAFIVKALKKFGLQDIHTERSPLISKDYDFLFSPNRDFTKWPVVAVDGGYARKPKRPSHALRGILPLPGRTDT